MEMYRKALLATLSLVLSLVILSGCTLTGHLYNLATGAVGTVTYEWNGSGHGTISSVMSDGEQFQGEYSTISGGSITTHGASAFASGSGGYAWVQGSGFSLTQPGVQYGMATVVGDRGTIIEVVYAVDSFTNHGYGVGQDNNGVRYRIQF